jgi:hypothetical protein
VTEVRLTGQGVGAVSSFAASTPLGPVRAHVVATCWAGAMTMSRLRYGEPDPTPDQLDAIADTIAISHGVRPTVRVIELAFHRPPEPTP